MAIEELPIGARSFFEEVRDSGQFSCDAKLIQFQVKFNGELLGGFNRSLEHWYLVKRFTDRTRGEQTAAAHGFKLTPRSGNAPFWRLDGAENAHAFKAVIEELTQSHL
ncbi:hypothetical protein HA397_24910 [Escherichia coli]|nr:hypothetical protein [Escherichia coli]